MPIGTRSSRAIHRDNAIQRVEQLIPARPDTSKMVGASGDDAPIPIRGQAQS
jgi:hypothetical protein